MRCGWRWSGDGCDAATSALFIHGVIAVRRAFGGQDDFAG